MKIEKLKTMGKVRKVKRINKNYFSLETNFETFIFKLFLFFVFIFLLFFS
jgi:hypothetical protein